MKINGTQREVLALLHFLDKMSEVLYVDAPCTSIASCGYSNEIRY
jgi:hypothetical protein